MMAGRAADDIGAVADIVPVSRETGEALDRFVALVGKWQTAENLISPNSLPEIWRRHVADSAQLVGLFPEVSRWLDLGSGGGFPGIVVAALMLGRPDGHVDLVESNTRKCAFLRQAIRETGVPARVREGRIEDVIADWREPVGMITARALAPLDRLLGLADPLLAGGGRAAFHKGQDFEREIAEASRSWSIDLVKHKSRIDEKGVILEIVHAAPRALSKASAGPQSR